MENLALFNHQSLHHDDKYRCICTTRNPYLNLLKNAGISSETHYVVTEIGIFADDTQGIPFEYDKNGVHGDTAMNILAHLLLNIKALADVRDAARDLNCKIDFNGSTSPNDIPYIDTIKEFGYVKIRKFFNDININVNGNVYVPVLDTLNDIWNEWPTTVSEPHDRHVIQYTILQENSPALLVDEIL